MICQLRPDIGSCSGEWVIVVNSGNYKIRDFPSVSAFDPFLANSFGLFCTENSGNRCVVLDRCETHIITDSPRAVTSWPPRAWCVNTFALSLSLSLSLSAQVPGLSNFAVTTRYASCRRRLGAEGDWHSSGISAGTQFWCRGGNGLGGGGKRLSGDWDKKKCNYIKSLTEILLNFNQYFSPPLSLSLPPHHPAPPSLPHPTADADAAGWARAPHVHSDAGKHVLTCTRKSRCVYLSLVVKGNALGLSLRWSRRFDDEEEEEGGGVEETGLN